jgi:hypothetical protein
VLIFITQGRYTREAIRCCLPRQPPPASAICAPRWQFEAKGAFAAAGDLAPSYRSPGGS